MTQLTNEMIIQSLNKSSPFFRLELILFGVMFLVFGIVYFIKLKKEQNTGRKKGIIIGIAIVVLLLGIPVGKGFLKYSAIQNSIKNNSFEVVTDTVVRTSSSTDDDGDTTHYVYLTNNGKITVSRNTYYDCSQGKSVYVVIAKGIFGGKYPTGQLYLTSRYQYVDK